MISQKSITIISVSVAVFCIAVVVLIWRFPIPTPVPYVTPSNYEVPTVSPLPSSAPIPTGDNQVRTPVSFKAISFPTPTSVAVIQDPGVTWLSKPIKIQTDSTILKPDYGTDGLEFYKIGTQNGKDLIVVLINYGVGGDAPYLLRKEADRYALITGSSIEPFSGKVYLDQSTELKSITWPEKLEVNGVKFEIGGYGFGGSYFFDDNQEKNWKLFGNTPHGPMYYDGEFAIRSPYGARMDYRPAYDFMTDDRVAAFKWNDGKINTVTYADGLTGGCGSISPRIATLQEINNQVFRSGTTTAGEPIYEFINMNHPIVLEGYKNTNGQYYTYSQENGGAEYTLSLEQYYYNHGVVVYRDQLGRFVAFFNGTFAPQAECGKPVIYLYPEKPTQVSVKVGAKITVSEPEYETGWNVFAQPNGTLTTNGTEYQSLYWEGLGYGAYPEITQGFIVKRENLEVTLRKHLTRLGANARESQDFLDFWLAKMPATPYTRLTWFGTEEMDILAPLYVNPKPDTSIRVFLDFEGLDKPIDLPMQKLSSIPRKGHVLFEWGGLLRNGHHTNP